MQTYDFSAECMGILNMAYFHKKDMKGVVG